MKYMTTGNIIFLRETFSKVLYAINIFERKKCANSYYDLSYLTKFQHNL